VSVLENPRAKQLAAGTGADTEPEACEPAIKMDNVRLAGRQDERGNGPGVELHGSPCAPVPALVTLGKHWAGFPWHLPASLVRTKYHEIAGKQEPCHFPVRAGSLGAISC